MLLFQMQTASEGMASQTSSVPDVFRRDSHQVNVFKIHCFPDLTRLEILLACASRLRMRLAHNSTEDSRLASTRQRFQRRKRTCKASVTGLLASRGSQSHGINRGVSKCLIGCSIVRSAAGNLSTPKFQTTRQAPCETRWAGWLKSHHFPKAVCACAVQIARKHRSTSDINWCTEISYR